MRGAALEEHPAGTAVARSQHEEVATAVEQDAPVSAPHGRWRARRPANGWVPTRVVRRVRQGAHDAGMATAEYAIATLAAVGFAGLLVVILKGNEVKGLLNGIIKQALSL